jgi:hypothetical protein
MANKPINMLQVRRTLLLLISGRYQKATMYDFRKILMHRKWKIRMHDFSLFCC